MSRSPGQLFIFRGNLTHFACDAWLVSTDRRMHLLEPWHGAIAKHIKWPAANGESGLNDRDTLERLLETPDDLLQWTEGEKRVLRFKRDIWPKRAPEPFLTLIGRKQPPEWYAEGVRQFLEAVRSAGDSIKRFPRPRPLAALPLVGTRFGGGAEIPGQIVTALLPVLLEATQNGLDVALVTFDAEHYAAAQHARHRYAKQHRVNFWPELDRDREDGMSLRKKADELAQKASAGKLALFLGSGVSFNAGLPVWGDLLASLAAQLPNYPLKDLDDLARFNQLDYLDRATILQRRFGDPAKLQQAIVDAFTPHPYYTLSHGLLASLPTREAVTTNYDALFETACTFDIEPKPAVLPYDPPTDSRRWLLKMHGCVRRGKHDIVLTRDSFLGYGEARSALAGVVQGMMLTRHLLFVGFSLDDYNFFRIAHAVRQVVRGADSATANPLQFGTTLTLGTNPFRQELWADELDAVPMIDDEDPDKSEAGRVLEIFLDYLLAQTRDVSHLLRKGYESLLETPDQRLVQRLREFIEDIPATEKLGLVWRELRLRLDELGWLDPGKASLGHESRGKVR